MKTLSTLLLVLCLAFTTASCAHRQVSTTKGPSLLVTRMVLAHGYREPWGYGAYSYLLIPALASSDERHVALLKAFSALPRDEKIAVEVVLQQRNLTIALTDDNCPSGSAEWLLSHYDYERATTLLFELKLNERGPYIVTSNVPLPFSQGTPLAIVDMSALDIAEIEPFFEYFVRSSRAPEEWGRRGVELVLLRLHHLLKEMGLAMDVTIAAVEPASKLLRVAGATR